ncbi:hypothetical protein HPP05_30405 [Corallococcus exiguus]|uniref:DUF3592 domain-containing protein n=1 Tax=Corallococcus TaxID=83461 RepID=UPI0011C39C24|nr:MULTISPECIES: DUF3592 domain-containing protein [Corallococcus]NPC74076.1 hypothetical protein [Corallococcus exiguus]
MSHFYHQTFTARDIAALSEHDQALLDASALWSYGRLFAPGDSIVSIAMHIFELVSHPVATNCRNCHQRAGWPRAHMGRTPFAAYKEFRRRHMFQLWVLIRPEDGGEPLEIGLSTGKASRFKYGDQVQVLYNPKQPRHVVLPGENLWVGLSILGAIGLVVLCAPFLVGL